MSFKKSPLYKALTSKDPDKVANAIDIIQNDEKFDVDLCDKNGEGYLHLCAILEGESKDGPSLVPVVFCLGNAGIELDIKDNKGNTALHAAVINESGNKMVNALFKIGMDPTITNLDDNTAGDYVPDDEGNSVYAVFEMMYPGLWASVEADDQEKVEELLDYWCKVHVVRHRKSLIDTAKARPEPNEAIIELLEKAEKTMNLVHYALAMNNSKVKELLKDPDTNPDTVDESFINHKGHIVPMPLLGVVSMLGYTDIAKTLIKKGANVNIIVTNPTSKESQPLYYYLMIKAESVDETFLKYLDKSDLRLIKEEKRDVLWRAYKSRWPLEIMEYLHNNGYSLFERDEGGHTLRQQIFIDSITVPEDKQRKNLLFVDEHVLGYVASGDLQKLKDLAYNGYYDLNVKNKKGKTAASLARKKEQIDVAVFLEELDEFQSRLNKLHKAIENANLIEARQYLDDNRMVKAKDRGGRNALHKAVLFERKFVIQYLLKNFPESLNTRDNHGRTPLHYACSIPDNQDIEDMLMRVGADETAKDKDGKTPLDYKADEKLNFIMKEREDVPGMDVWLREQYHKMVDAIAEGDLGMVVKLRKELPEWINLEEMSKKMYVLKTEKRPKNLLFVCIDYEEEEIGLYLIEEGLDAAVRGPYGKNGATISVSEAAEAKKMSDLADLAETAMQMAEEDERERREEEERKALESGDGHVDMNGNAKQNGRQTRQSPGASPEGEEKKSKSCAIL